MNNLRKEEKLCSKKLINELFINGKSFIADNFKVTWLVVTLNSDIPNKLLISANSHKLKKAVHRNKIKRQIKEAFRKNKSFYYDFLKQNNKQTVFAIYYNSKELLPYSEIETKIILILQRLILLISNE